jgi:hypothetical protein
VPTKGKLDTVPRYFYCGQMAFTFHELLPRMKCPEKHRHMKTKDRVRPLIRKGCRVATACVTCNGVKAVSA